MSTHSHNSPAEKKIKCFGLTDNKIEKDEYTDDTELTENEDEIVMTNDVDDDCDNVNEDSDLFQFPPDEDITEMLEEVEYTAKFPTITERYFTPYYKLNIRELADDIRILVHSNRICMLSLAPSHIILQSGRKITKVDFKVSEKLDRSRNKVSGKSKHGAQPLQANSNICTISSSDGKIYMIKCCMIGKLVEVNEMLLENPELLFQPPHRGGYLAIILPNIKLLDKMRESLLTQEQYEEAMLQRQNSMKLANAFEKNYDNHNQDSEKDNRELLSNNKDQLIFLATS